MTRGLVTARTPRVGTNVFGNVYIHKPFLRSRPRTGKLKVDGEHSGGVRGCESRSRSLAGGPNDSYNRDRGVDQHRDRGGSEKVRDQVLARRSFHFDENQSERQKTEKDSPEHKHSLHSEPLAS